MNGTCWQIRLQIISFLNTRIFTKHKRYTAIITYDLFLWIRSWIEFLIDIFQCNFPMISLNEWYYKSEKYSRIIELRNDDYWYSKSIKFILFKLEILIFTLLKAHTNFRSFLSIDFVMFPCFSSTLFNGFCLTGTLQS